MGTIVPAKGTRLRGLMRTHGGLHPPAPPIPVPAIAGDEVWGEITGNVTDQLDLSRILGLGEVDLGSVSGNITIDLSTGASFKMTLIGNANALLINGIASRTTVLTVYTGTGEFDLNFATDVQWANDDPISITKVANKMDLISLYYTGVVFIPTVSQNHRVIRTLINVKCLNFGTLNTTKLVNMGDCFDWGYGDSWSVSMWVKPYFLNPLQGELITNALGADDVAQGGWDVRYDEHGAFMFFQSTNVNNDRFNVVTVNTFAPGTWYHVVFTHDGSTGGKNSAADGKIYVQAVNQTLSIIHPTPAPTGTGKPHIKASLNIGGIANGTAPYPSNGWYSGKINQVTMWNKVLSAGEVTSLYNAGHPVDNSALTFFSSCVAWWYLNETDDATHVVDHAGSHPGTPLAVVSGDYVTDVP